MSSSDEPCAIRTRRPPSRCICPLPAPALCRCALTPIMNHTDVSDLVLPPPSCMQT